MEMTALSHAFNIVSDRAAEMTLAALWQGAFIAVLPALCLRFAPRISAAYRFAAWAAAFVAMVCLSLFSLMPESVAAAARAISAQANGFANPPLVIFDARWSLAIAGLWLAASLYRAADLAVHSLRLCKLWMDAKPVQIDERVEALLTGAASECGRGPIEVCATTTLQRPSVIGFFKPRILIPDWLFARLTPGELEQIVLHEAEHLRRRDDWSNLAQKLCLVLFPLNPALAWIEHRLCREREMACDEGVVRVTRAPRAYAACLTSLAERGLERRVEALSLGAWQRRPELVHRVQSILRSKGGLSPLGARVLLGSLGCGLLAGSVALGRSPQLVAFEPERSAVAVNQTEKLNPAKTAPELPLLTASAEPAKAASRTVHAAISRSSSNNGSPVAINATLREPSQAGAIALKTTTSRKANDVAKNAQDQQWLVLTEWEQVVVPVDNAGLTSDYDTGATIAKNESAPASPDQRPLSRVTVTQLIFKIPSSSAGSNSTTKHGASPSASQRGIAVFRDGWLVIQL